jgi:hypothetical protein
MIEALKIGFRKFVAGGALALAAIALMPAAHAAAVSPTHGSLSGDADELFSDTVLHLPSDGKLTVQVSDLGVPLTIMDRLQSLSFSITSGTDVLGSMAREGALTVNVTNLSSVALHIFAIPTAVTQNFRFGAISWKATFEAPAPVPLPASFSLLIAGAAWAIGLQRKRARLAVKESSGLLDGCASPALAH